jgi:endonuclease G
MSFEYLTVEEQNIIIDAFLETDVEYDGTTRKLFMRGINRIFVSNHLSITSSDPNKQLISDLMALNNIERLIDGSVPLKQWLNNAVRVFSPFTQLSIFQKDLSKVEQLSKASDVMLRDEDIPTIEIEEIITGEVDDFQEVTFLSNGAKRVSGVAKILVPRFEKGKREYINGNIPFVSSGTGWLISNNFLVTNYHVIENRAEYEEEISKEDLQKQVINSQAQFFFDDEGHEGVCLGISELIAFSKDSNKDFAILKLSETLEDISFLPVLNEKVVLPKPVQLDKGKAIKPLAVNIIQHPGGGPKRIALRNNLVYSAEYPLLHYYTDTLGGSSGSPVFNDSWQVIGLHRAAVSKQTEFNGKKIGYINQGIQIHSILASLEKLAQTDEKIADAWSEIKSFQNI